MSPPPKFDMWQTTSTKFHRHFENDPEKFQQSLHKLSPGNQLISYVNEAQCPGVDMPASTYKTSNNLKVDHELGHYLNQVKYISDTRIGRIQQIAEVKWYWGRLCRLPCNLPIIPSCHTSAIGIRNTHTYTMIRNTHLYNYKCLLLEDCVCM